MPTLFNQKNNFDPGRSSPFSNSGVTSNTLMKIIRSGSNKIQTLRKIIQPLRKIIMPHIYFNNTLDNTLIILIVFFFINKKILFMDKGGLDAHE